MYLNNRRVIGLKNGQEDIPNGQHMKLKPLLLSTLLIFTTGVTAGADYKPSFDQLKW